MAIRRADSRFRRWSFFLPVVFLVQQAALGRGRYTAQVRGTVTDPAHAVVNNAKVTVTNESTSIATTATTNAQGRVCGERAAPRELHRQGGGAWLPQCSADEIGAGGEPTGHGRFRVEPGVDQGEEDRPGYDAKVMAGIATTAV